MHGTYDGVQLPEFGNKAIGCHNCNLDIHGTPKTPTWTLVESTLEIGVTTLVTTELTNWAVGDILIISSSDYDHNEAEEVSITAISNTSITFAPALKFKHYSAIETYGATQFGMQVEVGVLTRNVVI